MKLDDRTKALLDQRREAAAKRAIAEKCAAELRAFYHPKQAAFFRSKHKRRATRKTRRAGVTTGGCRELLARAIEHPGFRATYVASTRIEARARAWVNDTANGLVNILREFGEAVDGPGVERVKLGGIVVEVREAELALEFENGSRIELFGADNIRAVGKKRGGAKHVVWVDEAQDFVHLEAFYKGVVYPALRDFKGECWITGTPGRDCAGMFYDITKQDETDGPRLPGWELHEVSIIDNPFFGATEEERWEAATGEALREHGWSPDDPDFLREMRGLWVRADARYVFKVHAVPEHRLCYAPARYASDGFPDIEAALADLPMWGRRTYFLALGADLGTRDDFAFVLWAWSLEDQTLYEVVSWKKAGLDYDEMEHHLVVVRETVPIGVVAADSGGGGLGAVKGWSKRWQARYSVPVEEADKSGGVEMQVKMMNNDIRREKLRLRKGGVLHGEMKLLRWAKVRSATGRLEVDPATPDHACDAGRIGFVHCYHHRARVPEDKPPPGSQARHDIEEREHERAIEEALEEDAPWWS